MSSLPVSYKSLSKLDTHCCICHLALPGKNACFEQYGYKFCKVACVRRFQSDYVPQIRAETERKASASLNSGDTSGGGGVC